MKEYIPASAGDDAVTDGENIKRALAYLRVSTKEQANRHGSEDGYSLPTQRTEVHRKAEALGAVIVEEYLDKDTGTSTDKRPNMQRLLANLQDGTHEVDFVIVPKLDRWARNAREDLNADFVLELAGAELVSCAESIDRTAPGRLLHSLLASVNEYHSRNLSDEIKRKTVAKAKAGGTPYQAPTGYLNVQDGIDVRYVVIDPERAPHVAWAFHAYATGEWTVRALTDALADRGLVSKGTKKAPSRPLKMTNVHRMLRHPYYKGLVRYKGVEYQGTHEPLVTPELWQQVQDVLDSHRNGEKSRQHPHYLKSTLFCGHCGSRLCVNHSKGHLGKRYPYFMCIGRHQGRTNCPLRARPIELVEEQVAHLYKRIRASIQMVEQLREVLLAELASQRITATEERNRQQRRVKDLEAERRKLLELHYADAMPADLFKEEQQRITRELTMAKAAVENAFASIETIEQTVNRALDWARDCHGAYLSAKPTVRRQMNQAFFDAIFITEDGVHRYEMAEPFASLIALGEYMRDAPRRLCCVEAGTPGKQNIPAQADEDVHALRVNAVPVVEVMGFEPTASSMRPKLDADRCSV